MVPYGHFAVWAHTANPTRGTHLWNLGRWWWPYCQCAVYVWSWRTAKRRGKRAGQRRFAVLGWEGHTAKAENVPCVLWKSTRQSLEFCRDILPRRTAKPGVLPCHFGRSTRQRGCRWLTRSDLFWQDSAVLLWEGTRKSVCRVILEEAHGKVSLPTRIRPCGVCRAIWHDKDFAVFRSGFADDKSVISGSDTIRAQKRKNLIVSRIINGSRIKHQV